MVYAHLAWQERCGTPGLPEFYPAEKDVSDGSSIVHWHPISSINEVFGRWQPTAPALDLSHRWSVHHPDEMRRIEAAS